MERVKLFPVSDRLAENVSTVEFTHQQDLDSWQRKRYEEANIIFGVVNMEARRAHKQKLMDKLNNIK